MFVVMRLISEFDVAIPGGLATAGLPVGVVGMLLVYATRAEAEAAWPRAEVYEVEFKGDGK